MIIKIDDDKLIAGKRQSYYMARLAACLFLVILVSVLTIGYFNAWQFSRSSVKDMRILTFVIFLTFVSLPFMLYNILGLFGTFSIRFNKLNQKIKRGLKHFGSFEDVETIEIQTTKLKGRTDYFQLKLFLKTGTYTVVDESLDRNYLEKEEKKLFKFLNLKYHAE